MEKDHLNVYFAKNKQPYKERIFHLHYTVSLHVGSQSKDRASIQKKKALPTYPLPGPMGRVSPN